MRDMNELLQQLGGQNADPQMLSHLQALAGNAQCRALADQLKSASAEEMRQAVQRGNADEIKQAVGQFLSTPEGTRLAAQLRQALGK